MAETNATLREDAELLHAQKAPKELAELLATRFVASYVGESLKTFAGTEKIMIELTGAQLSNYCEWAGEDILRICASALEDANFHKESAKVLELIRE